MSPQICLENNDLSTALMGFLNQYADEHIGPQSASSFQFAARDDVGNLLGGVTGRLAHGVLSVQLLALAPGARRAGLGAQLLKTLETAAIDQGATVARVDTLEFEAPDFYQKQGYKIFGIIGDLVGRRQYFLSKSLVASK
jgi:GNAT superfamily N-acetyltransferase